MVVSFFVSHGEDEAAVLDWLMAETYYRPSEPLRLRSDDVAVPRDGLDHEAQLETG